MVRITLFIFLFLFPKISLSEELTDQEKLLFNFVDLNKDANISFEEMGKLNELFFQLLDKNQDGNISELEIIELKYILKSIL